MKNYGVLVGIAKKFTRDNDSDPHAEILLDVDGKNFRIAVNVRSSRGPVEKRLIEYVIKHDIQHSVINKAFELEQGWHDLTNGQNNEVAIDYIRSNIFRAKELKPVPHTQPGPYNDLFEYLEDFIQRAIDEESLVYAFGEHWGPEEDKEDQYFNFKPGNGIHLIHMNQGDSNSNKPYRDGALIFNFKNSGSNAGVFLKFQNQVWHTDENNGTPIEGAPSVPAISIPDTGDISPWSVVPTNSPYHLARIVSAIVNPIDNDPSRESVTILNISSEILDINGWSILDKNDNTESLSGTINPSETKTITLTGRGAQLSNKGGTITLLNAQGLKVDGVAYTNEQAQKEGCPVVFINS